MKVVVLGGGIVGVTTALFLARDGHAVTVIDRQPGVALECSYANGGYVAVSQAVPWSAPGVPRKTLLGMLKADPPILLHARQLPKIWRWGLDFLRCSRADVSWQNTLHVLRLSMYSFDALKESRAAAGIEYDAVAQGCLKVFSDRETLDKTVAISEKQRPYGLTHRTLTVKDCVALAPALAAKADSLAGGIHFPDEENGDCYAFARGAEAWCRAHGVDFRFGTRIRALERDGDRIARVATDAGRVSGDAYVLALGADSPLVLRPLGVRLPIIPIKGYSYTLPRELWPEAPRLPVLDEKRKFGFAPLGADRLRFTGFAEIQGYDTVPETGRAQAFVGAFTSLFPQLKPVFAKFDGKPFCCLRPVTPDGPPILGRSRYSNLWYNVGQGHLGWTLAHGCARILAALVAGRDPGIDMTGYAPRKGQ